MLFYPQPPTVNSQPENPMQQDLIERLSNAKELTQQLLVRL